MDKSVLEQTGVCCTRDEWNQFKDFVLRRLWNDYNNDYMDKRIIAQNQLNELLISIPNGTVGREYKVAFSVPKEVVEVITLDGLGGTGLKYEVKDNLCAIYGIPIVAGVFSVALTCKHRDWVVGRPYIRRMFTMAINPDPKSLWKNIPTSKDIVYYQPDSECDYVKVVEKNGTPQKDIVVASQRGRSHANEGNPRDDHYNVKYLDNSGWYIMAVADGAGSAKYSRKGSVLACDAAVSHCEKFLSDEGGLKAFEADIDSYQKEGSPASQKKMGDSIYQLVGQAAFSGYKAIETESTNHQSPMKDYSTTLLLSVCKRFEFGWFVASFWVGDGAMCIYDKDRQYFKLLGSPDEGEFAGQTRFLTMPIIFKDAKSFYGRLRFSVEQDFTALMLMTDGVSDPMFETDANLNRIEKWNELYENITKEVQLVDDNEKSKDQLLRWLDFWSKGNHDDRTIAILY